MRPADKNHEGRHRERSHEFGLIENNGEPWMARTSDPMIKSAFMNTAAGYG